MTRAEATGRVRRLSRTSAESLSSANITILLNEGIQEFAKMAHGLMTENYVTLTPKFDTRTNFYLAISVDGASATTLAVTAATRDNASGGTVASDLQTSIQTVWASATASWHSTTWRFDLTIPGSTSIAVAAPSGITQISALELIFGGAASGTAVVSGGFPEDCTLEASLPTGFLSMNYVEWDGGELKNSTFDIFLSPQHTGTPEVYAVKSRKIRLYPVPTSQKLFKIFYKHIPASWSSATSASALDSEYHMAPVYYAAHTVLEENGEMDKSKREYTKFQAQVFQYISQENNQNPRMIPRGNQMILPKVTFYDA